MLLAAGTWLFVKAVLKEHGYMNELTGWIGYMTEEKGYIVY